MHRISGGDTLFGAVRVFNTIMQYRLRNVPSKL